MTEAFAERLAGGHPNSLGETEAVAAAVIADPARMPELYACYGSPDAVVRLRTSSAIKRVTWATPETVMPFLDRLISEIGELDQASAQWTLAEIFLSLGPRMSEQARAGARAVMQRNLSDHGDWIVLIKTMETLAAWAGEDPDLRTWLRPHLERLSADRRKSVRTKAQRIAAAL